MIYKKLRSSFFSVKFILELKFVIASLKIHELKFQNSVPLSR